MTLRKTQLPVIEVRAQLLIEWAGKRPETVRTIQDVHDLPEIRGWAPHITNEVIDYLVADGRFVEDAIGVLIVKPKAVER